MTGQVTGAYLRQRFTEILRERIVNGQKEFWICFEPEWGVIPYSDSVTIGLPQTNEDVFYNTMVYNLIRRKQRACEFNGRLTVQLRGAE